MMSLLEKRGLCHWETWWYIKISKCAGDHLRKLKIVKVLKTSLGTPQVIFAKVVLSCYLMYYFWNVMYCFRQFLILPYSFSFGNNIQWSTVSDALERTIKTPRLKNCYSVSKLLIWSVSCITACSIECHYGLLIFYGRIYCIFKKNSSNQIIDMNIIGVVHISS